MIDALKKQFLDALVGMLFLQQAKNERNKVNNELQKLKNEVDDAEFELDNEKEKFKEGKKFGSWIGPFFGGLAGGYFIGGILIAIIVSIIASIFGFDMNSIQNYMMISLLIIAILAGVGVAYSEANDKSGIENAQKALATAENALAKDSPALETQISRIDVTISQIQAKCDELCAFLPQKYRTLHAIDFMFEALDNMRADTLKEVINLYESHLSDMELKQQLNRMQIASAIQTQELQIMNSMMDKLEKNQSSMSDDIADIKNMQYNEWIQNNS